MRLSGKVETAPVGRPLSAKVRIGALLAVLLLGGCGSGSDEANSGEVTIALPPTEPFHEPPLETVAAPANLSANAAMTAEEEEKASPEAEDQADPAPQAEAPAPKAKAPAEKAAEPKAAEKAPEPPAKASAARPAAGERPPLSDAAIAGTIRRIGYACPEVSSSARMESDPATGAPRYRIVCSSGDSYQATARDGNIRFRRLTTPANR